VIDEECSALLDRRKQAKLQWLQNPNQMNGDNMDNMRREGGRTFRTKKYQINELHTVRAKILQSCSEHINEFKKGYQPRRNFLKDKMVICLLRLVLKS
jgi:hypothetical protein